MLQAGLLRAIPQVDQETAVRLALPRSMPLPAASREAPAGQQASGDGDSKAAMTQADKRRQGHAGASHTASRSEPPDRRQQIQDSVGQHNSRNRGKLPRLHRPGRQPVR